MTFGVLYDVTTPNHSEIVTTPNHSHIQPAYLRTPWYVTGIEGLSNSLSLIGAILIFVTYFKFQPDERTFLRKLLLYLTIANCIEVLGNYVDIFRYFHYNHEPGRQPTDALCFLQSFTTSFAPAVSYLWTSVIAVFFKMRLYKPDCEEFMSSMCAEVFYHVVCWCMPAVVVFLAIFNNVFGEDFKIYGDTGCWIRSDMPRGDVIKWMILTNKLWEIVSLIIIGEVVCFIIFQTKIKPRLVRGGYYTEPLVNQAEIEAQDERLRSKDRNFLYIWMLLFLVRFFGHLRFFLIAANPSFKISEKSNIALMCLQVFGDSAQAFVNFVILCLCDASARRRLCSCNSNGDGRALLVNDDVADGVDEVA